jgi:hypothetical protein
MGWSPPKIAGVYAIMSRSNPKNKPQQYSVIYVGHAEDLSQVGFPLKHPYAQSWIKRSGDKFNLFVCYLEILGGTIAHREQISKELQSIYKPSCNDEVYDKAWKDEWIGEYNSITTDPLTTNRDPNL